MSHFAKLHVSTLVLFMALVAAGCATMEPPKPWERGDLTKASMQIDPDKLETKIQQHVYTSKEAATPLGSRPSSKPPPP